MLATCGGDGSADSLTRTAWTVTTIDNHAALREATPWLRFDDGARVTGSTGCNSFGGAWHASGSDITFDDLASTLIGCPAPIGDQEAAFTAALQETKSYTLEHDTLTLTDASGTPRLTFVPRTGEDDTPVP